MKGRMFSSQQIEILKLGNKDYIEQLYSSGKIEEVKDLSRNIFTYTRNIDKHTIPAIIIKTPFEAHFIDFEKKEYREITEEEINQTETKCYEIKSVIAVPEDYKEIYSIVCGDYNKDFDNEEETEIIKILTVKELERNCETPKEMLGYIEKHIEKIEELKTWIEDEKRLDPYMTNTDINEIVGLDSKNINSTLNYVMSGKIEEIIDVMMTFKLSDIEAKCFLNIAPSKFEKILDETIEKLEDGTDYSKVEFIHKIKELRKETTQENMERMEKKSIDLDIKKEEQLKEIYNNSEEKYENFISQSGITFTELKNTVKESGINLNFIKKLFDFTNKKELQISSNAEPFNSKEEIKKEVTSLEKLYLAACDAKLDEMEKILNVNEGDITINDSIKGTTSFLKITETAKYGRDLIPFIEKYEADLELKNGDGKDCMDIAIEKKDMEKIIIFKEAGIELGDYYEKILETKDGDLIEFSKAEIEGEQFERREKSEL